VPIAFDKAIPILRIFDVEKAKEFYVGYLGFKIDFEHQFEPDTPYYIGISRGELRFHLSEHYGDGSPGAAVYVEMEGVEEFHRELAEKNYKYLRPGLDTTPWNTRCVNVVDPFGNKIRFNEEIR
jgi:catechol 2,3-dioxygenase-like lactoylglutathione lyase family enzyme